MRIQKFQAPSMKEALAAIKRELGPEAMVVATSTNKKGIEVTAAVEDGADLPAAAYGPKGNGKPPAIAMSDEDIERIMAPLRSEIRSLRSLVRSIAQDRGEGQLKNELVAVRQAIAQMGRPGTGELPPLDQVAAKVTLSARSQKRIVALVGPTGVGKTTTIAKLAARAALVEHKHVVILTLDNYRVGGEEQMRTFADLIGAPMVAVANPEEILPAIAAHKDAHRIFIDTAGRSPRDSQPIAELARAFSPVRELEVHLAVPAATSAAVLDGIFRRYQEIGLDHILFTKLDEADDLSELVRAPARLSTTVSHLATGQRVPEDLEDASDERLLALAQGGLPSAVAA
jgi:flagellar biosynthesis protein FlhF